MTMTHKGVKVAALLFLVGAYLFLNRMASLPKAPAIAATPASERRPFPIDIALPGLDGQVVRLSDLHGQVVLLNFWATWCPPCRIEMPSMNALYQDYRDRDFEILAISNDVQGANVVGPLVDAYELTFPVLLDPQNVVGSRLFVQGFL